MTKISLIIPIYNTPLPFVERMLRSVFCQNFGSEVEVIAVDDGSSPEYRMELKACLGKYPKLVLIEKGHSGLSATRNTGADYAQGEYLCFLDSDDTISADFFKKAVEYLDTYQADVIYGGIEFVPETGWYVQSGGQVDLFCGEDVNRVKEALFEVRGRKYNYTIIGSACGRLYKKAIFDRIRFDEGLGYSEDQIFNRKVLNSIRSAAVVPDLWYQYYSNPVSMVHNSKMTDCFQVHGKYWSVLLALNQQEGSPIYQSRLRVRALGLFYSYIGKYIITGQGSFSQKLHEMKTVSEHELIRDACRNLSYWDNQIMAKESVVLYLVKHRLFFLLYILVKVKNNEHW